MKTIKPAALKALINAGRVEVVSEPTRAGYAEIRWIRSGKRESVLVA